MMNCAVHQVLKISLKIVLLISLSAIYFAVAIVQGFQINNLYGERWVHRFFLPLKCNEF